MSETLLQDPHTRLESRPVTAPTETLQPSARLGHFHPKGRARKGLIVRQRSLIAITAALAAGALTLTACGSRDENGGGSGSGGAGTKVVIGVDAPLTGDLSALGLGIRNSAELAVKVRRLPDLAARELHAQRVIEDVLADDEPLIQRGRIHERLECAASLTACACRTIEL